MIRRLAKPVAVVVALGCVSVAMQHAEFLEAVTANLASLIDGASLVVGDKTLSGFALETSAPGAGVTLPDSHAITVTADVGAGNTVTLTVPLHLAAAGGAEPASAELSFNVAVTGSSDVISGLTVAATGTGTTAGVLANLVDGDTNIGHVSTPVPGSGSTALSGLTSLGVGATATALPNTSVDEIVFTVQETTPTSSQVPEPGSLTLVIGGVVMLAARTLRRRRR